VEQEKLKQLFKRVINESENNEITTIKDMIHFLAVEMKKV